MRITPLAVIVCAALPFGALAADPINNFQLRLRETGLPVFGDASIRPPTAVYSVSASGTSADGEVALRKGTDISRMTGYSIGRTFSEQEADFAIGDFLDTLPDKVDAAKLDWTETLKALANDLKTVNTNSQYVVFPNEQDPARRILFARGGTVKLPFMERDGNGRLVTNEVVLTIGGTSGKKRPYRLYATDPKENNTAAYVDLTGKYVKFYGAPELLTPRYDVPAESPVASVVGPAVSNVIWGLDYDPAKSPYLSARYISKSDGTYDSPEGSFVMVYFKTELKRDVAAAIVVQIVPPEVTTLEAEVGDELRPIGGGYDVEDLHVSVASGADSDPNDPFAPYVEVSGSSTVRAIVPTDKSTNALGIDMPWKANLYWKSADAMGTLWTFENDWYLVRWPADPLRLVISPEKDDPGLGFVIPTNYTVSVGSFRDPVAMNVGHDAASGRVTCDREGRFVLKLLAGKGGDAWYLPVETFEHGNMKVCSGHFDPIPWPVGRRVTPVADPDTNAPSRAAFADVDPDLPGFIYARFSSGRNWNPRLYHEPKADLAAQLAEFGSSVPGADGNLAADPYAKLESAIYGVNECRDKSVPGTVEVWWRSTWWDLGMPTPITYPSYVQVYRFTWDGALDDGNFPEIVLSSQQGSFDANGRMTAAGGRAARLVWNYSAGSVEYPGGYRVISPTETGFSFMLYVPAPGELAKGDAVAAGRLARLGAGGNRANDVKIDLAAVGTNEATVTVGSVTNTVPRGVWTPVALERLPDSFAGGNLEVSFGDDDEKLDGESAVGVSIDGIELRGADGCVYRFDFSDADLGLSEDGMERIATASEGKGSFRGFAIEPDEPGAPRLYRGLFLTENGVAPELYYQNDPDAVGFNPNEEHAFLTEEREGAFVAWALRNDLNVQTNADSSPAVVFVDYAANGKGRMQGFRVVTLSKDYPTFSVSGESGDDDGSGGGIGNGLGAGNGEVVVNPSTNISAYAGQRLIPPAPLGKLLGCDVPQSFAVSLVGGNGSQVVYIDRKSAMWARRDGVVNVYYGYATEEKYGFYLPGYGTFKGGQVLGWMNGEGTFMPSPEQLCNIQSSQPWTWTIVWPRNVPTMKIGQTLTKAKDGLPEVWNAASMAVAYQPDEERGANGNYAVSLIDPTVARTSGKSLAIEADFPKEYGFTVGPAGTCFLRQGKYYFTGLPPSISDRFYVDVNAAPTNRMVLVGQLVEKEAGGSYLELNVLSDAERQALRDICRTENEAKLRSWNESVDALARTEVRPVEFRMEKMSPQASGLRQQFNFTNGADYVKWTADIRGDSNFVVRAWKAVGANNVTNSYRVVTWTNAPPVDARGVNQYVATWQLLKTYERPDNPDKSRRFTADGEFVWWPAQPSEAPRIAYAPRDHYALVASGRSGGYVTLVENDDPDPSRVNEGLPVSMHVIRVVPELYVDGIAAVRDPLSKLSELQTMLYRTPLGSAANDFEFEWRRKRPNADGTLDAPGENWDVKVTGDSIVSVQLGGSGDVEDYVNNYYTLRYRPKKDTAVWKTLAAAHSEWKKDDEFWSAWATPQLAEGWLQRALNSVTPFAQRVEDFYSNPSDISYTMLEQIGRPYQGDVALNNDNLASVGLLELYQTLFNRTESLLGSLKSPDTDLGKQLLLAATRLNEFYALLGAEAYADAKNPLIGAADGTQFAAGVFSFANQVTTLLDEELALLRGRAASTAFPLLTEPPCYNRLAWNMTKGQTEGEAAYVCNYGIRARNGVLDVNCAAAQYPQGHGDAYGHYLSALTTYYRLIRNPKFAWTTSMSEMLMDQKTMNVDYQDEQKFADAALNLAKTGRDAMALTYRKAYAERGLGIGDWGLGNGGTGYFDADEKQAFGYGEWATRTGMGGVYNWMAANALLPPPSNAVNQVFADRGIARIDRSTAYSLAVLCETVKDLDRDLGAFDAGANPLRLDEGTIPFDIDPEALEAANGERKSHFEQILERTERALGNCRTVLGYANAYGARLRQLQESETDALAARETQERAYDDALVAIYGTPFSGDIGPGGTYPQGYDGPDIYNYNWIDLSPYGISAELETAFQTNLTAYYAYNYGRAGQVTPMTNAVTKIDYTVTAGGIRIKPARITGVRAAEGTLQGKYRDYILAYQALVGAIAGYGSAVNKMNDVAYDVRLQLARINIDNIIKGVNKYVAGLQDDCTLEIARARWQMVEDGFANLQVLVSAGTGLQVVGAATGTDTLKTLSLRGTQVRLSGQALMLKPAQILAETMSDTLSTVLQVYDWATFLFDTSWDWYQAIRDNGDKLQSAVTEVSAAIGAVQEKLAALDAAQAAYRAEVERGERLQQERERWRRQLANEATASRYADMFNRVERNLALSRYTTAFDTAQRYVWELAKVYDYETGLLSSDARSGRQFLADVIATRSLGEEGVSISSGTTDGGLYDVVNRLKENWSVLKGRLGINNPDKPEKWFSLRYENFRISPEADGDEMWRMRLKSFKVDDIRADPFFRRYCQPLAGVTGEKEPGLVIAFSTSINGAKNFFGRDLMGGQSQFSPADYATRIVGVGVDFAGYDALTTQTRTGLALEPNVYLVPVGADYMRAPAGTEEREVLKWNVVDQVMPLPYAIGSTQLDDNDWFSSLAGADGIGIGTIRRHSTLRAGAAFNSTRLVGRSVWNDRWLLVIPAASLNSDRERALETFIDGVKDIRLGIKAYSRQGN